MHNLLEAIRADAAESTNQSRLSAQRKLHTYLSSGGRGLYLAIAMAPKTVTLEQAERKQQQAVDFPEQDRRCGSS